MAAGKIKKLVENKGFGFITPTDGTNGNKDVFFHCSALTNGVKFDDLNEDDKVTFDLVDGKEGKKKAENVELQFS